MNMLSYAQHGIYNAGNLQLHNKGSLGFHTGLINDGAFDKNKGTIGFYKEEPVAISGNSSPAFYDLELAVDGNLFIETSITITNSLSFIYGNIVAARNDKNVYVSLMPKTYYVGEGPLTKIDGHAAINGQKEFLFPIGYDDKFRPLKIRFIDGAFFARCEYYNENPSNPLSTYESFDTSKKPANLGDINSEEYWNLSTSGVVQISLSLDPESERTKLVEDLSQVTIVGWSKKKRQWEELGNAGYEGVPAEGYVTSNPFNANNYEIFTTSLLFDSDLILPGNYALSPNGDGINDVLKFSITSQSPNNHLMIFDRTGKLVYEKSDYQNEFNGNANKGRALNGKGLPEGTYFYLLELIDLNIKHKGYFYIAR
ncbi:MAG: gliding motility-associated C-terminal domain-containing protein [Eudoraea sp.]|nr:gliding motility-associated C-terminal domain-containing protein [Eudoraea sp.]